MPRPVNSVSYLILPGSSLVVSGSLSIFCSSFDRFSNSLAMGAWIIGDFLFLSRFSGTRKSGKKQEIAYYPPVVSGSSSVVLGLHSGVVSGAKLLFSSEVWFSLGFSFEFSIEF